jgi:hypothetical protein
LALCYGSGVFLRSRIAIICASFYLLLFFCALLYPLFDHRTFSGLAAVLLTLPWSDHIRGVGTPLLITACVMLNAIIIYVVIAALSGVLSIIRHR